MYDFIADVICVAPIPVDVFFFAPALRSTAFRLYIYAPCLKNSLLPFVQKKEMIQVDFVSNLVVSCLNSDKLRFGLENMEAPMSSVLTFRHACRADQEKLEDLLAEAQQLPITALFCHADIKGASYNSVAQAFNGILPKQFPSHVPSYTGHYHKPHVVPGSQITYLGSPFQCMSH